MNRRAFFKFLPIAPVAFAAEGARAATVDAAPLPDQPTLTLSASVRNTPIKPTSNFVGMVYTPWEIDHTKRVSMTVGQDGNLWLKTEAGQWKRVVTE